MMTRRYKTLPIWHSKPDSQASKPLPFWRGLCTFPSPDGLDSA
jgi:hypothetical protein